MDKIEKESLDRKLQEVIEANPFIDEHHLSPHWYVSELCRYLQNRIRNNELSETQYNILKALSVNEIKQNLHYKGLSLVE